MIKYTIYKINKKQLYALHNILTKKKHFHLNKSKDFLSTFEINDDCVRIKNRQVHTFKNFQNFESENVVDQIFDY